MKKVLVILALVALGLLVTGLIVGPGLVERAPARTSPPPESAREYRELAMVGSSRLLDLTEWSPAQAGEEEAPCEDNACLGISGGVLRPNVNDVEWQYGGDGGCIYVESGNRNTLWSAPLYLPQGAKVTRLTMYADDSHSYRDTVAWLSIFDHSGEIVDQWGVESSGSSGMGSWSSEEFSHLVDHWQYHYVVHWQPGELGDDMQLCGFLVDYEPPAADGMEGEQASELGDDLYTGLPMIKAPPDCLDQGLPPDSELPAILPLDDPGHWSQTGERRLCLYGFPEGERIDLTLFTPDGEHEQHGAFRIDEPRLTGFVIIEPLQTPTPGPVKAMTTYEFARIIGEIRQPKVMDALKLARVTLVEEIEELEAVQLEPIIVMVVGEPQPAETSLAAWRVGDTTVLNVPLWWPASLPSGVWIVKAEAPGAEATVPVIFEPLTGISTRPDSDINMFVNLHCSTYQPGRDVVIEGAGYDPLREVRLGLYMPGGKGLVLADSLWTETDGEGSFSRQHRVKSTYAASTYYILMAPMPEGGFVMATGQPCFRVVRP